MINIIESPVEPLSTGKKCISSNIRKLMKGTEDERLLSLEKYSNLKSKGRSDEEIVEQIKKESILANLTKEFDEIMKSGKDKIDEIIEL